MGSQAIALTELKVNLQKPVFVKPAEPCENTEALFLSNIDQSLAFTVETVYFYAANPDKPNNTAAETIRDALARSLVHYDFLAGRARLNEQQMRLEIDRNYAGAQFSTGSCDLTLQELGDVTAPNPLFRFSNTNLPIRSDMWELGCGRNLVPQAHNASTLLDIPLMMIQVTTFKCGGFTIGFGMSHLVWDGHGVVHFLMNLMSLARGGPLMFPVDPDRTMLKARNPPTPKYDHPESLKPDELPASMTGPFTTPDASKSDFQGLFASKKHITKIIPFSLEDIATLKARAMEGGELSKASTFDALSGHVWQARTKAIDSAPLQLAQLSYAVDIRERMNPALPKQFCGNGIYSACARATWEEIRSKPLSFCVKQVQAANERITDDYVRSGLDWWEVYRGIPAIPSGIFISSWQKMPFYAIDFGWGKPLFAGPTVTPMVEFVVLLPNGKHDGGLNVILALQPEEMARFEEYAKVTA